MDFLFGVDVRSEVLGCLELTATLLSYAGHCSRTRYRSILCVKVPTIAMQCSDRCTKNRCVGEAALNSTRCVTRTRAAPDAHQLHPADAKTDVGASGKAEDEFLPSHSARSHWRFALGSVCSVFRRPLQDAIEHQRPGVSASASGRDRPSRCLWI